MSTINRLRRAKFILTEKTPEASRGPALLVASNRFRELTRRNCALLPTGPFYPRLALAPARREAGLGADRLLRIADLLGHLRFDPL